jgi:excisionase family DNA binding protein
MLELPDFSTVNEVAARTRLSRASVRRAIRLGRLRALRPDGIRRLLIPADALRAFLQPRLDVPDHSTANAHTVADARVTARAPR